MQHTKLNVHAYACTRSELDAAIKWLLDRGSWFEVEWEDGDHYYLTCAFAPTELLTTALGADNDQDS